MQLFIILTRSFAHPISNAHLFSLGAADRLFVTPLWLPGIDHFPIQVTVSPLSPLSRRLRGTGKEFSIPTKQLVSCTLVRLCPLSGKLSDFYFNRSFAGRD